MKLPNVTIVSPFRQNGCEYVDRYFNQAYALTGQDRLRWNIVEGDSTDDTLKRIIHHSIHDKRIKVIKCDVNKPKHGSVVNAERFQILAQVFNAGMDLVDLKWSDYAMFIPSDVSYGPDLIDRLISWDKDLIAPMYWANEGTHGRFYDIWGFCYQGRSFPPAPPAFFAANYPAEPFEMDTVGGVILMRAEVLKVGCRYTPEEVDHGLCHMAQAAGYKVWCDPTTHIVHP